MKGTFRTLAVLWQGAAPELELSGPGVTRRPIPEAWLRHEAPETGVSKVKTYNADQKGKP
jgi:hypothetical protein